MQGKIRRITKEDRLSVHVEEPLSKRPTPPMTQAKRHATHASRIPPTYEAVVPGTLFRTQSGFANHGS